MRRDKYPALSSVPGPWPGFYTFALVLVVMLGPPAFVVGVLYLLEALQ